MKIDNHALYSPSDVKCPAAGCVPMTSQTTSGETRSKNGDWSDVPSEEASSSISVLVGYGAML
jgi:hypothetical protein